MILEPTALADALSLEYKRNYGYASGEAKLSDLVNYPPLASEFRRLGLGLSEESLGLILGDVGTTGNDVADTPLVRINTV